MKSFIHYLVESSIINESYKNAEILFSKDNDEVTVAETLKKFKELVAANRVKPEYKDITVWMRKPFEDLHKFVRQLEITPSGKQAKKDIKGNSITLKTFGNWIAIIPLSKGASCFYGKGTQWCTAATQSDNYFDSYFDRGITLIYFINKVDGTRYAAALKANEDNLGVDYGDSGEEYHEKLNIECYDERDNSITPSELSSELSISFDELRQMVDAASEHETVNSTRASAKYVKLAKYVKEILVKKVHNNASYNLYQEIRDILKDEDLSKSVDAETIEKLNQRMEECYGDSVRYQISLVIQNLKPIKHLLTKPEEELLNYSIYIRGSIGDFIRQVSRLPKGYEKYSNASEVEEIHSADSTGRRILDAIHKQQQAQQ